MRLGGIYALEGVMNTSKQYHQPVLEALCAFVRDSTIGKIVGTEPATDIQAALTVIGRRADGLGRVNLTQANIPGSELSRSQPEPRHHDNRLFAPAESELQPSGAERSRRFICAGFPCTLADKDGVPTYLRSLLSCSLM